MKFCVITLFPEMFDNLKLGIVGRAQQDQRIELSFINPRDFTQDVHKTVDDRPFGGGPGMVMKYQPLRDAIAQAKEQLPSAPVLYLSPQGQVLSQTQLQQASNELNELILLCGRYEGIDERLIERWVDQEWSIGDYVLSGGELAAMVVIDGLTRLLPGVLGHQDSASQDSFSDGLLDHPHYTRPEQIDELRVPKVLLSGDHAAIKAWRAEQAYQKTCEKRPDLVKSRPQIDIEEESK